MRHYHLTANLGKSRTLVSEQTLVSAPEEEIDAQTIRLWGLKLKDRCGEREH